MGLSLTKVALKILRPLMLPKVAKTVKASPSDLVSTFLRLWERYGGPELKSEREFSPKGSKRSFRADYHIEIHRVVWVIELDGVTGGDGLGSHRNLTGFCRDRQRDIMATLSGIRMIRFTAPALKRCPLVVREVINAMTGRAVDWSVFSEDPIPPPPPPPNIKNFCH